MTGDGAAACVRGHPQTGENVRVRPGHGRICRRCERERAAETPEHLTEWGEYAPEEGETGPAGRAPWPGHRTVMWGA